MDPGETSSSSFMVVATLVRGGEGVVPVIWMPQAQVQSPVWLQAGRAWPGREPALGVEAGRQVRLTGTGDGTVVQRILVGDISCSRE